MKTYNGVCLSCLPASALPSQPFGINVGTVDPGVVVRVIIQLPQSGALSYETTSDGTTGQVNITIPEEDRKKLNHFVSGDITLIVENKATGLPLTFTTENGTSTDCAVLKFHSVCPKPTEASTLLVHPVEDCGPLCGPEGSLPVPEDCAPGICEDPGPSKYYGTDEQGEKGYHDVPGGGGGSGDMTKAVYDPQNIEDDAFDRANHTGTQLAATISDFQTEVSNNGDVQANAAGVSQNAGDIALLTPQVNANTTHAQTTSGNPHNVTKAQVGAIGAVSEDNNPTLSADLQTSGNKIQGGASLDIIASIISFIAQTATATVNYEGNNNVSFNIQTDGGNKGVTLFFAGINDELRIQPFNAEVVKFLTQNTEFNGLRLTGNLLTNDQDIVNANATLNLRNDSTIRMTVASARIAGNGSGVDAVLNMRPGSLANSVLNMLDNLGNGGVRLTYDATNNRLQFDSVDTGTSKTVQFALPSKFTDQVTFETELVNHQRGTGNVTHQLQAGIGSGEVATIVLKKADGTKGLELEYDGGGGVSNIKTDASVPLALNGLKLPLTPAPRAHSIMKASQADPTQLTWVSFSDIAIGTAFDNVGATELTPGSTLVEIDANFSLSAGSENLAVVNGGNRAGFDYTGSSYPPGAGETLIGTVTVTFNIVSPSNNSIVEVGVGLNGVLAPDTVDAVAFNRAADTKIITFVYPVELAQTDTVSVFLGSTDAVTDWLSASIGFDMTPAVNLIGRPSTSTP